MAGRPTEGMRADRKAAERRQRISHAGCAQQWPGRERRKDFAIARVRLDVRSPTCWVCSTMATRIPKIPEHPPWTVYADGVASPTFGTRGRPRIMEVQQGNRIVRKYLQARPTLI